MLEYYRAVPENASRNQDLSAARAPIPVLLTAVRLEDVGHYVAEERPEAVAVALDRFATRVVGTH